VRLPAQQQKGLGSLDPRVSMHAMAVEPQPDFISWPIQVKPAVYVTYNGDFFDWPFIEARAKHHGMDMHDKLGFRINRSGEYLSKGAVHMDCLCWVNRDSYLPQGSRGLKVSYQCGLHLLYVPQMAPAMANIVEFFASSPLSSVSSLAIATGVAAPSLAWCTDI
jgi:hypothetical protein